MNEFQLVSAAVGSDTYHGLLRTVSSSKTLVVHVHGTGGDFFTNPFICPLADVYANAGISFLTANFPGWGEQAATERFLAFGPALGAWLKAVKWSGKLILQGHSLGALKVIHALSERTFGASPNVQGVVLLAPFDVVAFYCGGDEKKAKQIRAKMSALDISNDESALVPKEIFKAWPISIGTFRELIADNGPADQFPSRKENAGARLDQLHIPALVAIGSEDFAAFPSVKNVLDQMSPTELLSVRQISGAPHNFAGKTDELANAIQSWLTDNSARWQ
jgi:alpha/beta superfamily hydrolase